MHPDAWLVVIDPQRIFASPDSEWGSPMFPDIVEPVRRLASAAGERCADEVPVRSGAVGARVHAVGAEACGGDEHRDRTAGVVGRGGRHHVLPAGRQVGDLDDHVDQGLAGVDDTAHRGVPACSTSSVVASVICGG